MVLSRNINSKHCEVLANKTDHSFSRNDADSRANSSDSSCRTDCQNSAIFKVTGCRVRRLSSGSVGGEVRGDEFRSQ